jgi:hypothetical protein
MEVTGSQDGVRLYRYTHNHSYLQVSLFRIPSWSCWSCCSHLGFTLSSGKEPSLEEGSG